MQGFYISGDKLVTVGSDEFKHAVWAVYHEVIEAHDFYVVRAVQFAVDDCNAVYVDEHYPAGREVANSIVHVGETYHEAIDYLVSRYDQCDGSINHNGH